jgi:hypothetical protein
MDNAETIDITSDAFARRLANLLKDRRETSGATLRQLARASDRAFDTRFLRAAEDGRAELDEQTVCELAALYGAELAEILPSRLPLRIEADEDAERGVIATSGITARFDPRDPDSLLTSYLLLVRQLRAQQSEPLIDLRREDVDTIAEFLHEPGPSVVERLSTLMGATQLQRRAMVGMFIAGAIVIGLAGSGVAALAGGSDAPSRPAAIVAPVESTFATGSPPTTVTAIAISATGTTSDATTISTTGTGSSDTAVSATRGIGDAAGDLAATGPTRATLPSGEPLGGAPGAVKPPATTPTTTPTPTQAIVPNTSPAPVSAAPSVPAAPSPGDPTPTAGSPGTSGGAPAPDVATGEPPVPQEPTAAVGEPPSPPTTSPPPEPELTIPDLPYDPPATTTPATVATTAPPPAPANDPGPATGPPPVPTTHQVATGEPPVPPAEP